MKENRFEIEDVSLYKRICGYRDKNLKAIEKILDVNIIPRGNTLIVNDIRDKSEKVIMLLHLLGDYLHLKESNYEFDEFDIKYLAKTVAAGKSINAKDIDNLKIFISDSGRSIYPRTINQAHYISLIHRSPITFSYGPAGTGKTFLAVAVALSYMQSGKVERIILTRPAVEAGESLGYLPGDLIQKINPYLRPLYDALFELSEYERISNFMERGIIEIAPLAYMRGRTLNNSFVILDEVFGSQDMGRRELIFQSLARLKERFPQMILVTHLEELKHKVETLIELVPQPGGWSEVRVNGDIV